MINSVSPVLLKFVGKQRQTNPLKGAIKYKFNARVQESHVNLLNFTKDSTFSYLKKKHDFRQIRLI